jgi:hypothetical protein
MCYFFFITLYEWDFFIWSRICSIPSKLRLHLLHVYDLPVPWITCRCCIDSSIFLNFFLHISHSYLLKTFSKKINCWIILVKNIKTFALRSNRSEWFCWFKIIFSSFDSKLLLFLIYNYTSKQRIVSTYVHELNCNLFVLLFSSHMDNSHQKFRSYRWNIGLFFSKTLMQNVKCVSILRLGWFIIPCTAFCIRIFSIPMNQRHDQILVQVSYWQFQIK